MEEKKELAVFWILFASVLVIEGRLASAALTYKKQSSCHNSDVVINCKYFAETESTKSVNLQWKFWSGNRWKKLAQVRGGSRKQFSNAHFGDRLVFHTNGSLEIKGLKPKDATQYMCKVSQRGKRDKHIVELSVKCDGRVTITRQDVCVEHDVLLGCDAKHRTNPHHFKDLKWQKYEGRFWSLVPATREDGTKLYSNGTLLIPAGRRPGDSKYKCTVSNNVESNLKEKHIVELRNVKCHRERVEVKVCGGLLTSITGVLQSPNYPKAYPANSHCEWTITVPKTYTAIQISIDNISLEQEKNCQNDYISVTDELGNQVGCRKCGSFKKPITLQVQGRTAKIVFTSDSAVQKTGFQLTYRAVL